MGPQRADHQATQTDPRGEADPFKSRAYETNDRPDRSSDFSCADGHEGPLRVAHAVSRPIAINQLGDTGKTEHACGGDSENPCKNIHDGEDSSPAFDPSQPSRVVP